MLLKTLTPPGTPPGIDVVLINLQYQVCLIEIDCEWLAMMCILFFTGDLGVCLAGVPCCGALPKRLSYNLKALCSIPADDKDIPWQESFVII